MILKLCSLLHYVMIMLMIMNVLGYKILGLNIFLII